MGRVDTASRMRTMKHTFEDHPVLTRPYGPRLLTDQASGPFTDRTSAPCAYTDAQATCMCVEVALPQRQVRDG